METVRHYSEDGAPTGDEKANGPLEIALLTFTNLSQVRMDVYESLIETTLYAFQPRLNTAKPLLCVKRDLFKQGNSCFHDVSQFFAPVKQWLVRYSGRSHTACCAAE